MGETWEKGIQINWDTDTERREQYVKKEGEREHDWTMMYLKAM